MQWKLWNPPKLSDKKSAKTIHFHSTTIAKTVKLNFAQIAVCYSLKYLLSYTLAQRP